MFDLRACVMSAFLSGCLLPAAANAQTPSTGSGQPYPSKTVRIVVGLAPGGATDVKASLVAQGIDQAPSTPEDLEKYVASEIRKWAKVAQESGIKLE